jgi:hypothetical protein
VPDDAGSAQVPAAPSLQFAFEIQAQCSPSVHIGTSPAEVVEFTPVVGGPVAGPLFNGSVIPGGGDWSTTRGESCQVEARYLIRSDDGAVVDVLNRGYWLSSPSVDARLEAGESVEESEYYFRCAPIFRTDDPRYLWMAQHQFVGKALDGGEGLIRIQVFLVR